MRRLSFSPSGRKVSNEVRRGFPPFRQPPSSSGNLRPSKAWETADFYLSERNPFRSGPLMGDAHPQAPAGITVVRDRRALPPSPRLQKGTTPKNEGTEGERKPSRNQGHHAAKFPTTPRPTGRNTARIKAGALIIPVYHAMWFCSLLHIVGMRQTTRERMRQ